MLPSLWEKDFHRVVTRWANAHGPVFKMRIMQFHVSVRVGVGGGGVI